MEFRVAYLTVGEPSVYRFCKDIKDALIVYRKSVTSKKYYDCCLEAKEAGGGWECFCLEARKVFKVNSI